jgi:hypothetical protein
MGDKFEALRKRYRPAQVGVLFIGESRPANGTFFYAGDSRLSQYTEEAFSAMYRPFRDPQSFLACFRDLNCYLVDLCPCPVNNLPRRQRTAARKAGKDHLVSTIAELQPDAAVVVMKGIKKLAMRAISQATQQSIPIRVLSFPAQGHEREYVTELTRVVQEFKDQGTLKSRC